MKARKLEANVSKLRDLLLAARAELTSWQEFFRIAKLFKWMEYPSPSQILTSEWVIASIDQTMADTEWDATESRPVDWTPEQLDYLLKCLNELKGNTNG